ncbi:sensor histidine kinase [Clostridium sp. DL1XJH146]
MTSKIRKKIKMNTIKKKMISYYMIMIIFMSILSIYSLSITNKYKEQIDSMFVRTLIIKDISDELSLVDKELVIYLSTKSSDSLNNYMMHTDKLKKNTTKLSGEIKNYTEEELMFMDIENMVNEYILETEKAISEKRKTDVMAYTNTYDEILNTMNYIMDYISELNNRQLYRNATNYTYMSKQIETANFLNVILIIDLILLAIIIVYKTTNKMIRPLIKLSHSAEDISKGNFTTEEVVVKTNDEIEILSIAFNKMKKSIHVYIEQLKEKAATETKLKDKEMENIKMESLLNNARLYALQSQMNPHFLFNTINAAVQLAMIERADRTSEFLENMSRVYRYNIKQIDSEVTITQEVQNVKDYYELLKVRFGDLIQFHFKIEESEVDYRMPPLIMQPLVENAYIHGLSKKEDGGDVYISVLNEFSKTIIVVEDNGVGMTEDIIKEILESKECENKSEKLNKKSTGESPKIGMKNVIDRLELFYKCKGLVEIASIENKGTKVIISIPHYKGDIE